MKHTLDSTPLLRRRARVNARTVILFIALAYVSLLGAPADATTVVMQGTADLTDESDSIVTGTVVTTEARMHPDHQFIYTYVTLQVDEVLKGTRAAVGETIVLEELGGQVGPLIALVEGTPEFETGERVLAFLEDREEQLFRTYGMIQGKFRFETDERLGTQILTRPAEWHAILAASPQGPSDLTVSRGDGSYSASPLLEAIRDRVAQD